MRLRLDGVVHGGSLLPASPLPEAEAGGERNACEGRDGDQDSPGHAQFRAPIMRRMKYFVILAFLAIVASLGSALFFMMRDGQDGRPKTNNMARALAFRVGFSILLFVCILVAWKLGYIQPTGIPLR
jgi:hypothetical protein